MWVRGKEYQYQFQVHSPKTPFLPSEVEGLFRAKRERDESLMKPFYTYILQCADRSYYTGHTDDLETRIAQHQTGAIRGYTFERRPVELMWVQEYTTRYEAQELVASEERGFDRQGLGPAQALLQAAEGALWPR
jgi:predicted GIY-YIG superfamily endonuclease